ncbi:hypothetical protein H0H92_006077 [Tricholoma furcatifolium]|nr:hypothetical protein H0H92_006077 [Tricholoma furcatifolium]
MAVDTLPQKILPSHPPTIPWRSFNRRDTRTAVDAISARLGDEESYVGLSLLLNSSGAVEYLALATTREVLVISLECEKGLLVNDKSFEDLLASDFGKFTLVGFRMGHLAFHVACHLRLRVRGIDLSTTFGDTFNPLSPQAVVKAKIFSGVDVSSVDALWLGEQHRDLCLRAWLSAWWVSSCGVFACDAYALFSVAEKTAQELRRAKRVDTGILTCQETLCVGEFVKQNYVLDKIKPKEIQSEFTGFQSTKDGILKLQNARYKTRVRRGNQIVIMKNELGQEYHGQALGEKGRTTSIHFTGEALSGTLQQVRVFGPPQLTNHEKSRDEFILLLLQGTASLRVPFIRFLWFPPKAKMSDTTNSCLLSVASFQQLNPSQEAVALKMISDRPIVISHGPPGTGKTTTIAAAVSVWEKQKLPTWIVAHSNVAVKNMAETLFKKGIFFRILVSKEFHFEWHEHIYNEIQERVLVSDEILGVKDVHQLYRILGPTTVMLSTLSMLSSPNVDRVGLFRVVPVGRLVVDEASQIKIDDFMHILYKFRSPLKKLCFFGDPQQLPPHGKDQVPKIKTIFDIAHLRETAEFLDTQYRMPVPLGNFISHHVYHGRLKSEHTIKHSSCVTFVNVSSGIEAKSGFSWTNLQEIKAVVNIVRLYYRYRNFCIITPYDAQRSAIERQLKSENLPWEQVFNVDSFQGNEADFVIVSVVRSGSSPGFLSSKNRMNVLLTRCRRGLVIVSSQSFIRDGGRHTLLGCLERYWLEIPGSQTWVDWKRVADGIVDLPGAPGPNRGNTRYHSYPVTQAVSNVPASMSFSGSRSFWAGTAPNTTTPSSVVGTLSTYDAEFPPLAPYSASVDATVHKSPKAPLTRPAVPRCKPKSRQPDIQPKRDKAGASESLTPEILHQRHGRPVIIRLHISAEQIARARCQRPYSDVDNGEAKMKKSVSRVDRKGGPKAKLS